jgi:spermidine synthase
VTDEPASPPDRTRRLVPLAIGGLGVSAVMTQLALMRELLGAFSGNELVFGICLGNWLLLTGAGAWLGRFISPKNKTNEIASSAGTRAGDATPPSRTGGEGAAAPVRRFIVGLVCIAVVPLFQVVAVRVLRDVVFGRGVAVGVSGTVLGSLALLLPFCLVSGALLTLACGLLADAGDKAGLGRVYLADTAGGIAGGVLFSFVLVPWFDHFALLCFPAFLNLLLAGLLAWDRRAWLLLEAVVIVTAGLILHVALIDADLVTTVLQHRGEVPVFRANSPYGRLVVTDRDGLLTFYENGVPVAATENIAQVEEAVLYALSQRPGARRVLLIGGGVAGDAREILRAGGVSEVTYVELDPAIIAAGRQLLPENLDDARIRIAATDGRRFVRQTDARFDVVIVDLPDPSTSQLNRFYTAEFFGAVRRVLAPGGVFAFGLGHYENYVSPELARLLASARGPLAEIFPHVLLIPGGRVFFLASDGPLSLDIAARLEQRGLQPRLVNRHYLDAMLAPDRLADLDRAVARPAAPNTDFSPALYYYHLRHWLSQFAARSGVLGAVLALLLAAYLARLRAAPRVIFAAGFAASALEIVLLLAFQVLYGSLYQQVGLVVTVFMAGLAAGAWWANRGSRAQARPARWNALTSTHSRVLGSSRSTFASSRLLPVLALAIAALGAALPLLLRVLERLDTAAGTELAGQGLILLFTLALAALVGAQFPLAGAAANGEPAAVAARLYSADLIGAALGALLVSALLIPLLGVTTVCLFTAGLNAAAAALAWRMTTA